MDAIVEIENTIELRLSGLYLWENKVAQLNKRAKKHGMPEISYTTTDPHLVARPRYRDSHPQYRDNVTGEIVLEGVPHVYVTFSTETVRLAGYRPIAIISYEHSIPAVFTWPGEKADVEKVLAHDAGCDHCKAFRRRNRVFLLERDEDGERFFVGSTCVRDFIGYDPKAIIDQAKWLSELAQWKNNQSDEDDYRAGGGRAKPRLSVLQILSIANANVREHGWIPQSAVGSRGVSTAARVSEHLFCREERYRQYPKAQITQADLDAAAEAIRYVNAIEQPRNEYVLNLTAIAGDGFCTNKEFNLAVSIINFVITSKKFDAEHREREDRRTRQQVDRPASDYVGAVKERLTFPSVKIDFVKAIASNYGDSTLVKFITPEGNRLTWFATGVFDDHAAGDEVKLVGTVKRHGEYNGVRETTLTRCRVD